MKQALVALFALVALVAAETSSSTMPLFRWSGHRELSPKSESADKALASVLGSGETEVVMVYMMNEASTSSMQTRQAEFTHLEDALKGAKSSSFAALPVAEVSVDMVLATARANSVTGTTVEGSKLQAYLAANTDLMTNNKPEVIVVTFDAEMDGATADSLIGAAEKAVSAATTGKYDSILSTTASAITTDAGNLAFTFFPSDVVSGVRYIYANLTDANGLPTASPETVFNSLRYGSSTYLTPTLLLALLVMVYAAFLALASFCCIMNLQTPEKFEGDQESEMKRALRQGDK